MLPAVQHHANLAYDSSVDLGKMTRTSKQELPLQMSHEVRQLTDSFIGVTLTSMINARNPAKIQITWWSTDSQQLKYE